MKHLRRVPSAFVGIAVMIALVPVPGNVAKLLQSTERELMKKVCSSITIHEYLFDDALQTDARIQTITESTFSQ